jgi:hypothetical protein
VEDVYRDVPNYSGLYQVSRTGEIRGLKRGKVLCQVLGYRGYLRVNLYDGEGGVKHHLVHRLVAAAWLGPIPPGHQVNHIDGNKLNNVLSNLEVITAEANFQHAQRHGLLCTKGESNPKAKLTEAKVQEMRQLRSNGVSVRELAKRFNVSVRTVYLVVGRRTWGHVE